MEKLYLINLSVVQLNKYLALLIFLLLSLSAAPFQYHYLTTSDGVKVRVGRYCGSSAKMSKANKVLLILPGVESRIERHEFLANYYASSGFDVWVLDFRGQGGSQQLVENKQMTHVDDFSDYIRDVEALSQTTEIRNKPMSLFGHSMGGQVALQVLCKYPQKFELAILEAPMIRIKTYFPFFLAEPLAYIFKNWLGKGEQYCLNHRKPSWGWVYTALHTTREFLNNLSPLKKVTTKIFLASAGGDKVVDTQYDAMIASTLQKATHRTYKNAGHSLTQGTLATRKSYLADVSSFLEDPEKFIKNNTVEKSDML